MGEAREKVVFLSRLNDLANGGEQGFKNVTFERYVLGAILDEVVYAANLRLQKMSRSRYTLERSDYTGGGRGKQGLDLAGNWTLSQAIETSEYLVGWRNIFGIYGPSIRIS